MTGCTHLAGLDRHNGSRALGLQLLSLQAGRSASRPAGRVGVGANSSAAAPRHRSTTRGGRMLDTCSALHRTAFVARVCRQCPASRRSQARLQPAARLVALALPGCRQSCRPGLARRASCHPAAPRWPFLAHPCRCCPNNRHTGAPRVPQGGRQGQGLAARGSAARPALLSVQNRSMDLSKKDG